MMILVFHDQGTYLQVTWCKGLKTPCIFTLLLYLRKRRYIKKLWYKSKDFNLSLTPVTKSINSLLCLFYQLLF
jgi:hypothetical protein